MATPTAIAQITALLEKNILPTIQNQLYTKKVLLNRIARNPKGLSFKNNEIYITAGSSGHSGVGFTGATGAIPAGAPTRQQMKSIAKYGFGSHLLYDSAIQSATGDAGSLISLVKDFGSELEEEFKKQLNRQLYGNGEGTLTTVTTGTASTATHTVGNTRHLRVGQTLRVGTKAEIESGAADQVTIQSINSSTSVTFTAAITTATNDRVVIDGIYTGGAYQEIDGLSLLISNNTESAGGSLQNISRATNDWVNAYVESSTAALTEAQIVDLLTATSEFGETDFIMTTPALRNKYAALLSAQRQYTKPTELDGGFMGLTVAAGDKPVNMVADYDCPTGSLFAIDTTTLGLAELNQLEYLRSGSGGIMTDVYDTNGNRIPAYQVAMKYYGNLITTKPRANGKLTNKS